MDDALIELGLSEEGRDGSLTPATDFSTLVDRLLMLLADTTIESDTLRTAEFRSKLDKYRRRIGLAEGNSAELAFLTRECFGLCQNYQRRARKYLLDREVEFGEMIEVLREALANLSGEAKSFNIRLMNTSDRFHRLAEIQDIRELKKEISKEVQQLNRAVQEKQKQDEASYAKLSRRIEVLQSNLQKTKQEASLDPLTRVANRGSFDRTIEQWVASHKESEKPFVFGIIDLDNFKNINDTHGHQVGDRVLLCAAQWLGKYVRQTDFLARLGGEEFVLMLQDSQLAEASSRFTELTAKIANCAFEYRKDDEFREVRFTVSCGIAEYSPGETVEDVVRRADEALYEAKHTGKNKVVTAKKQKTLWQTIKPFVSLRD